MQVRSFTEDAFMAATHWLDIRLVFCGKTLKLTTAPYNVWDRHRLNHFQAHAMDERGVEYRIKWEIDFPNADIDQQCDWTDPVCIETFI
jgi:hypothetical protein